MGIRRVCGHSYIDSKITPLHTYILAKEKHLWQDEVLFPPIPHPGSMSLRGSCLQSVIYSHMYLCSTLSVYVDRCCVHTGTCCTWRPDDRHKYDNAVMKEEKGCRMHGLNQKPRNIGSSKEKTCKKQFIWLLSPHKEPGLCAPHLGLSGHSRILSAEMWDINAGGSQLSDWAEFFQSIGKFQSDLVVAFFST